MAERARTVRVSGLPTDIEDDRLKDKLLIHFLRRRNGGGEVESVSIVKATSECALITFEDSGVAQRVIQHSRHILEVDGKRHKVTVTEHWECPDPDKVILSLSATVNYSQLPGGLIALTSIQKSHPDVKISCHATKELYTLRGAYSKVQAALVQLLGPPGGFQPVETNHSDQPATSSSFTPQTTHKPNIQDLEDHGKKPNKQRIQKEKDRRVRPPNEYNPASYGHPTLGGYSWADPEGEHPTTPEDFSLIVDADMFQYLKKHCQKEYQKILRNYSVEVVDVTNQGLTTLFLQLETGGDEDGRGQERMKLAKKAISWLYQENETKIRRAQLPKNILSPRGGLQRAVENLSVRLPKLLLNEDAQNIYIIGSSSDVSEAKQFLLLDHGEEKEDLSSLLRHSPYDSPGTSTHAGTHMLPAISSSGVDPVDDRLSYLLRSEEDDRKDEGARKYKLAARFKDSGIGALSSRPTDFSLRGLSSPNKQAHVGPVLGRNVFSDVPGEGVPRAQAQNTGGDILFNNGNALSPARNKTPPNSHSTDTQPKSITTPLSGGSSSRPPAGSGSSLRRASSFSGTPQQKAQIVGQKSQEDPGKTRGRSSSFSNQPGSLKQEVYTAEITLSSIMWQHIKEVYSTRVDDLTSDVQAKETSSRGGTDVTVILRGASWAKVTSCQQGLQKLLDSVGVDFSLQELKLSELGITDNSDENLLACCAEARSQFKKVTFHILSSSLFLCGPKKLCSEVKASLLEVFSGVLAPSPDDSSSTSASSWYPSTFLQTNEGLGAGLQSYSSPQAMLESQTSPADVTDSRQERTANHRSYLQETELTNGSITQVSVKKDPVIKEKLKVVTTTEMEVKTGNERSASHLNGEGSTTSTVKDNREKNTQKDSTQQSQFEFHDTPEESRLATGGPECICLCGRSDKLMKKTKCGATFCSECLDAVHSQCKVCHKAEQTPLGSQGKMETSKIHLSLPGHKRDTAIKIIYIIPDGIQGERHPSPGKPFKGGVFEAFFPDCEETRKLLPRLQKAFRKGLTFTVAEKATGAKVIWDCIPHKTSVHGGRLSGYPDSSYLTRLSAVLTSKGIEETSVKSSE
ncbi:uncharacterized protein si:busm1-163l24.3 isoform X2 [Cheilinus undulatus]|uniref:uncharacterized protein si:busm1-163l24.3 isoform X2 n=1 Tax=Cheilinus undulatus TaxID=241271 RepID=UPI001BD1F4A4|nr:uncharacterized protein si:busm1-163l24.3 isoform X2 [Cheilinus undulatus]